MTTYSVQHQMILLVGPRYDMLSHFATHCHSTPRAVTHTHTHMYIQLCVLVTNMPQNTHCNTASATVGIASINLFSASLLASRTTMRHNVLELGSCLLLYLSYQRFLESRMLYRSFFTSATCRLLKRYNPAA